MNEREELYNLLKEVFLLLDSGDRQFFGRYDLTVPRYYTLYHLSETPGLSLSQLSDRLFCNKSNVTRIFRGLEEKGLVLRRNHETDGRVLRCFLTEEGTAVLARVSQVHKQYNENRLNYSDKRQQKNILESLTKLKQQLLEYSFLNYTGK